LAFRDGILHVPQGFKIDFHGGWCSPNGVFSPLRFNVDQEYPLRSRLNLHNYREPFTNLTDLAYWLGWSFMSYSHTYGGYQLNESNNAIRTFRFSFSPDDISSLRYRSILAMATVCDKYFKGKGKTFFEIDVISFSRPTSDSTNGMNIPVVVKAPVQAGTPLIPAGPIESASTVLRYHKLPFFKIGMLSVMSNAKSSQSQL